VNGRLRAWLPGARLRWGLAGLFALFLAVLPPLAGLHEQLDPSSSSRFDIFLGISAVVLALWAVSYNLMLGYTGLVSFAHAAYYGVGAYAVALLATRWHQPILVGLAAAPLVAAAFGLVTGLVALRAVRLYFALLTLAISQLIYSVANQWYDLTGGDNGIHGLTLPDQLSDYTTQYYLVAAVAGLALVLMLVLVRSPFGAALAAIRENRERARSIGINVKAYELAVYTVSAFFAGLAGGLFALYQQEAYPELLYWTSNAQPVVVALLGGTGTFLGPALGAFVYVVLQNTIAKNLPYQFDIVLGAIVLGVVLAVPGGLVDLPRLLARLRSRLRGQAEVAEESTGRAMEQADAALAARVEAVRASRAPPCSCWRASRASSAGCAPCGGWTSACGPAAGTRSSGPTGPASRRSSS
jgi:branched-chain amino acid transport system permease protein